MKDEILIINDIDITKIDGSNQLLFLIFSHGDQTTENLYEHAFRIPREVLRAFFVKSLHEIAPDRKEELLCFLEGLLK